MRGTCSLAPVVARAIRRGFEVLRGKESAWSAHVASGHEVAMGWVKPNGE